MIPAPTASSTTYWMVGLSMTGTISFGWLLVAGRNRVPSPAAGITAFRTFVIQPVLRIIGLASSIRLRPFSLARLRASWAAASNVRTLVPLWG